MLAERLYYNLIFAKLLTFLYISHNLSFFLNMDLKRHHTKRGTQFNKVCFRVSVLVHAAQPQVFVGEFFAFGIKVVAEN